MGESLLFLPSHLEKPVLNGLSDLLRLPQYPVLGVRATALTGVRREGELYTQAQAGGKRGREDAQDAHKSGDTINLRPPFPRKAGPGPQAPRPAPTGRASAPLDARGRAGQAAAARGTSARGGRRCNVPRPSRTHAFLRRPSPQKREQRARPADDRTFPARAARAVSRSGHRHPGRPAGRAKPFPPPNVLRVWRYAHSNPFENRRQARLAP